ncbi:MAG: hypothetical protein ACI9OH_003088 [Oleispira sp.]|jgi:hypothetical protein
MGHRKEFKNIAGGIVSSFKSRNNDIDGYWELAKLYDFANESKTDTVTLDLLKIETHPLSAEFIPLVRMWRAKLDAVLESRNIPIEWVADAKITAKFKQDYDEGIHIKEAIYGDPCTCKCVITSDLGKTYNVISGTRCMPHSSASFCRSTRRNHF